MKYYVDDNNRIYAYEDDYELIAKGLNPITEVEKDELLEAQKPEPIINPKATGEIYTLNNVDYQVPFMKDDADGLMQVNAAFQLGITETVIRFTNGTKMPITAAEFNDFAVWFVTKRNSFFI